MNSASTHNAIPRLEAALSLVRHDRWQLAAVGGDELLILGSGPQPAGRGHARATLSLPGRVPLSDLGRRAVVERRTVVGSTVRLLSQDQTAPNWDDQWPTVVHAPVGRSGRRPIGLLSVGCRDAVWYDDLDVDFISALAGSLTTFVLARTDPFRLLTRRERAVATLLAEGLSAPEVARALVISERVALDEVDRVLAKLGLRTPRAVRSLAERFTPPELSA